jgi:hypothetical protein
VPDGPTPNDPGDVDTGADALQNFTTVRSATTGLARSVVFGDLNSLPSRYYRVDIYMADDCDPRGQGSVWLGTVREWVNPSALGSFSFTRQSALPPGANITSLTTDLTSQNTSEFSPCRAVASDVSVGTVGLSAFASTTSLSTQLTLHWTPPGGGDIDNYDIDVRRAPWNGGFGAWASWKRGIHGTSATYTGKTSNSYCFRVRAHDLVGNTSAWSSSRCVGIPIPASSIPHGSPWTVNVRSQAFGDRLLRTTSLRAKLTRTSIVAHAIGVVATKCHGCGAIAITWNGTRVAVFSLEASSTTYQRVLIAKSWSTAQHGTLGIEVTTSGKPVLIEGIVVYQH